MREAFSLWPWVGAGTVNDSYRVDFAPLTIAGRARLFTFGFICYDPMTGLPLQGETDVNQGARQALRSAQHLKDIDGFALMRLQWEDNSAFEAAMHQLHGLYLWDYSLDAMLERATDFAAQAELTLSAVDPQFDPQPDVIVAAVDAIDRVDVLPDGAEALAHYSAVLDPAVPTPALEVGDRVDVEAVQREDTTDVSNGIGRADLAFQLVTCVQAAEVLPVIISEF